MGKSLVAAALAALVAAPASAQSLTDDEMLTRLRAQRDAMNAASEPGSTRGLATRGLTIVTLGDEGEPGNDAVTVEGTGTASSDLDPLDPNMPLVAARFDPSLAVDVRIEFEFDSAAISKTQLPALEQVCRVMTEATDINLFRIVGHTDASGGDEYNRRLSKLRAEEVGRHLVNECGISRSRLETVGYGEEFLADPDDPDAAANRRVEFQALS